MIVRSSLGGSRLRVTLSNALGKSPLRIGAVHVALRGRDSAIVATSDRAVTFGGRASLTVQPGALVVSDAVDLTVPALTELAVSIYVPDAAEVTSHALGLNTTYVAPGATVGAAALHGRANTGAIVAFGDSITDGFASTPNTYRAWPAVLAAKLERDAPAARWAVVNAGISGNRVRREVVGSSALARFDRDVLARAGVKWLLLFEGINDITFSALPRAPQDQRTTAEDLIEALSQIVGRAHAHGIRVMGGTLMPMGGLWLHNAETEAMRQAVNAWIRTTEELDAVADFDAATRDPERPDRLLPRFDSGDHIHPNDAGNAAMAEAIDTSAFGR
jgi:lysophospholipase L1-like esterase